jgi:hypothetical protein
MAPRKKQHTKINRSPLSPEISAPENSRQGSRRVRLDLDTLLAETPKHSVDFDWDTMSPVGREFR